MLDTKLGLTIRLADDHSAFMVELPSGTHARVTGEALAATMRRLLIEQKRAQIDEDKAAQAESEMTKQQAMLAHWMRFGVGTEASPTEQQRWHQDKHELFPVDTCPFCKAEGRIAPKKKPMLSLEDIA